jgi:hypothetical protein
MTYIAIVDLDESSKLGIHDFQIWNHLGFQTWYESSKQYNILYITILTTMELSVLIIQQDALVTMNGTGLNAEPYISLIRLVWAGWASAAFWVM